MAGLGRRLGGVRMWIMRGGAEGDRSIVHYGGEGQGGGFLWALLSCFEYVHAWEVGTWNTFYL